MESPPLPVELTDRIIDFCHTDKKALSNCALTHSSWLAASRFHLFYTITLKEDCEPAEIPTSHGRSSILPYIRTVKIESFYSHDGAPGLRSDVRFAHTIRKSCNLENLPAPPVHLRLVQFCHTASFSPINDIVTHVQLSDVRISNIWSFLSSFPQLQHLELEAVGPSGDPESGLPLDGIFDGIPLSTIRLATESMERVIRGLVKVAGSLSHLDDFGVEYQDVRQRELQRLADVIQKRVECLRFSASCHPGYGVHDQWRPSAFDIWIPDFVGRFRSLETLVLDNLRVDGSGRYRDSDLSFEWITGVLQQLSSPIQRLVFEVTAANYLQLNAIPWAFVDKIVTPETPQFRDLICVEVLVKRGGRWIESLPSIRSDRVRSEIILKLPTLNLLGILRCNTVGCE